MRYILVECQPDILRVIVRPAGLILINACAASDAKTIRLVLSLSEKLDLALRPHRPK